MNPLPAWKRPNNLQVHPHQAIVDRLNSIGQLLPAEDTQVQGTPTGPLIGSTVRAVTPLWEDWGIVVLKGPTGEAAMKLEQYWVYIAAASPRDITATLNNSRIRFFPDAGSGDVDLQRVVVATNLVELPRFDYNEPTGGSGSGSGSLVGLGGSHGIRPGQQIRVTATNVRFTGGSYIVYTFSATPSPLKAKITGYQALSGIVNRWRYTWTEQRIVKNGRWEDKPNGLSNTPLTSGDPTIYAYNLVEAFNAETGIQGNGVDITSLPSSYTIVPVRGTPIIDLYGWTNCDGEHEEYFSHENAIQGTCPV